MCSRKSSSGFTLIELLVVIAIIAILAAILFPVFGTAKKTAQAKACFGNVKTFGNAMLLYADDYTGFLPPCVQKELTSEYPDYPSRKTGRMLLYSYIRSRAAYRCPAMERAAAPWGGFEPYVQDIPGCYGLNQDVTSNDSDYQGRYLHRISDYPRPTRIIALGEVKSGFWGCNFSMADRAWVSVLAPFYHFGKMNVAFVDGHVRTMYLYDTLGTTPQEWMWWDPTVSTRGDLTYWQTKCVRDWLKSYPPFGNKT